MNVSIDEKRREAVERMQKIGIFPETVRQFEEEGLVSESTPPLAACYWLNDEQKQRVQEFEDQYNALVYHVIRGAYLFSDGARIEMECFLYVSDHREEWELDREDISDPDEMQALCYVYNVSDPEMSELGSIGFKLGPAAGLLRTW